MKRSSVLLIVGSLALATLPGVARAQAPAGAVRAEGTIVSVRADVLQVRPPGATALTRILIDDKTAILNMQPTSLDKLQPGMRLFGMGNYDDQGGVVPRFLIDVEDPSGPFKRKMRGIDANGYGRSAMFGGTIKTVKPLVVTDDFGQDIPATVAGPVPVMRWGKVSKDGLLVGQQISATGSKTADGLLHAQEVEVSMFGGSGGGGAQFGRVKSVRGKTLTAVPSFGSDPVTVTLGDKATVLRQTSLGPDSIKVGDTLTVQGRRTDGTAAAPKALVAVVLMPGKQSYPEAKGGNPFMDTGGDAPSQTVTGKVTSLTHPITLTLDNGQTVAVTIPGQTPIADLHPASLSDAKEGDRIMVIGAEGKDGGLVATTVVLGASPVVGNGG